MKKITLSLVLVTFVWFNAFAQQNQYDNISGTSVVSHSNYTKLPNFIKFQPGNEVQDADFIPWLQLNFHLDPAVSFQAYSTEHDQLGYTHVRYREYISGYPVDGSMLISHSKNGKVISFNGDYYLDVNTSYAASLSEQNALQDALNKINATFYKWQNKAEEASMKVMMNDPNFTYYPKGSLVLVHKTGNDYSAASFRLAWKFNIYAETPLSRANYYIDAQTGELISKENLIHDADVVGTASTVYSGTVTMTSDNYSGNNYRLQETGRGNGIRTYNMNNTTNYTTTDFTNNSSTWNLSPPNKAACDAHWGAEKTYDYYNLVHNRNSIDGNGYALLSYVHYSTNYVNAFWDGTRMTYGDGDVSQGFSIMTGLDVCGHEITHGLTSFTAALNGGEADALNEGFSDIFGTTIENYARPSQWDWIMGADITTNGSGIRTMSNPHLSAYPGPQPNTYLGQYWDPGGEPHNNNGPLIYWYYLICQGGSGTNDNNNTYNITGITMAQAQFIPFRALTVYMTPNTDYAACRTYTIQAALDLYGACSQQVITTTNAWYAVGVGGLFSATVTAAFTAGQTSSCSVPATIYFTNNSTNATNATWYFGDNTTSTQYNPSHTYTQPGTYTVSLHVSSTCGTDSVAHTSYITINPPAAPTASNVVSCTPSTFTLTATGSGTLGWYAQPTGGSALATGTSYTTPLLNNTTTYYVENDVPQAPVFDTPNSYNFGTGGQHNNTSTQYLTFDVFQNCTLATADVNAGGAGNRTFTLWDSNGNQLSQYTVNIPAAGVQTITLNIPLTPGSYRIGGTQMNLYRNNSGPTYPYTVPGVVSITGSSAGSSYYYYLYHWKMTLPSCTSARTPVVCTIGNTGVTYNAAPYDTLCSSSGSFALTGGSPSGGSYSGPGVSAGNFDPSSVGPGTYTVTYSQTDANGCTGTATQNIFVDVCTGISSQPTPGMGIDVYPNPANNNFTIDMNLLQSGSEMEISIVNLLGQTVYELKAPQVAGETKMDVNTSSWARGVYLLRVRTSAGIQTRKIEIN